MFSLPTRTFTSAVFPPCFFLRKASIFPAMGISRHQKSFFIRRKPCRLPARRHANAFTLIELLLVICIIAALAAIVIIAIKVETQDEFPSPQVTEDGQEPLPSQAERARVLEAPSARRTSLDPFSTMNSRIPFLTRHSVEDA